jgi:site-specific recombinase XerD
VSPIDGAVSFVVVDEVFTLHGAACSYLAHLRAAGRSPNTERVYAGRVALFLTYCSSAGWEWHDLSFGDLSRFLRSLVCDQLPGTADSPGGARFRSNGTANAIMTTVCEFLRFCASQGWADSALIQQLASPRFLRYRAVGHDWGEQEQFRQVNVRNLKLAETGGAVQSLAVDQVESLLGAAGHHRDRFLIALIDQTGIRIGEALGLRREDMHFLASSSRLGCPTRGPHVHIRRRANANGALAKSRFPRTIPVTDEVVRWYAAYQHERANVAGGDSCDFVFVNLFKPPLGGPMKYSNAKKLFNRLSASAGFESPARPHMLRHSAAKRWLASGTPRDVVQSLLGHVSSASMEVYLHPTDEVKRTAVERLGALNGSGE